jgi:hypothetical protein
VLKYIEIHWKSDNLEEDDWEEEKDQNKKKIKKSVYKRLPLFETSTSKKTSKTIMKITK